ncbi:excalibur calcium-binding domain-containing protein [Segeticoccus sp.]|uniref:excalibur calcium-binding domain-containing protein n=1 Tax=Segeticoccus sp. TaxID=2706531 RepID=UPI0039C93FC0
MPLNVLIIRRSSVQARPAPPALLRACGGFGRPLRPLPTQPPPLAGTVAAGTGDGPPARHDPARRATHRACRHTLPRCTAPTCRDRSRSPATTPQGLDRDHDGVACES